MKDESEEQSAMTSVIHLSVLRSLPTIAAALMALLVIAVRLKATKKPVSLIKLAIPPAGMSTGFLMFLFPATHIPLVYAVTALLSGFVLSIPLIRTSTFHVVKGDIYLKRSKAFIIVLLGLLVVRLALHSYVEAYITLAQTGAVFFILAFGMISLWRIVMIRGYLSVLKEISEH